MRDQAQQREQHETPQLPHVDAHDAGAQAARLGAGAVPAVHHPQDDAAREQTASELAYEPAAAVDDDANTKELKAKVGGLVDKKFGGDYKKAFDHYDSDHDGAVGKAELKALLEEAGVGNFATRGAWVNGIIKKLDSNGDGKIEWAEFESVFK